MLSLCFAYGLNVFILVFLVYLCYFLYEFSRYFHIILFQYTLIIASKDFFQCDAMQMLIYILRSLAFKTNKGRGTRICYLILDLALYWQVSHFTLSVINASILIFKRIIFRNFITNFWLLYAFYIWRCSWLWRGGV